jgi:DNA-binding MarR family transcriptional regulator
MQTMLGMQSPRILLRQQYWALHREIEQVTTPHGLTPTRYALLAMMQRRGRPLLQSEIVEMTLVSPSATATICGALVREGFLTRERVPGDRRRWVLALTPRATAALSAVAPALEERKRAHKTTRVPLLFATGTREVGSA